eukprot:5083972-Pleurochrysis_carterae.AAC.9
MGRGAKGPGPSGTNLRVSESWDEQAPGADKKPIEEGSERIPAVPIPFGTDTADAPTESSFHELQLHEQAQTVLAEIGAVLESSPSIALDMEAPFSGGSEGSGVQLVLLSKVGTQGKSRVGARTFAKSPLQSGLERWKGEN